ncbi:MAG: SUMF1/EgtB/PvdO family nonheme iron enzyme [Bacteroidota bacterium]
MRYARQSQPASCRWLLTDGILLREHRLADQLQLIHTTTPMNSLRIIIYRIILLLIIGTTLPSCNSQDQIRQIDVFSISGKIIGDGVDGANIVVHIGTQSDTTDANGNYVFTGVVNGNYVILPTSNDLEFTPDSLRITVKDHDIRGQNFVTYKRGSKVFTISGKIIGNGINVANIVVTDGFHLDTTDASGSYSFHGLPKGSYLIKPSGGGFQFAPSTRSIILNKNDSNNQDFLAALTIEMVDIRGGTFQMGSNNGQLNEKTIHSVTLSPFKIGKYEVTQDQWFLIMVTNPSTFPGGNHPVETVSWYNAIEFCNRLSNYKGMAPAYSINYSNQDTVITCNFSANGYRLPTEAEWEYACRAGTITDRYSGNMSSHATNFFRESNLDTIAWYNTVGTSDSTSGTHPVGQKQPNAFGLYDMQGNVTEWCWDYWSNSYSMSPQIDPTGATSRVC